MVVPEYLLRLAFLCLIGAAVSAQDRSPLVYSSFFGEAGPVAVEVDSQGAAWVFGRTESEGLPTTPEALQAERNPKICLSIGPGPAPNRSFPCGDLFVGRMKPDGSAFDFLTYIGGDGVDSARDMALAPDGSAYILAVTSEGLPTTPGVVDPAAARSGGWVGKIDPSGRLVWGTHLEALGVAADAIAAGGDGTVYLAGSTRSRHLPTTPGAIQSSSGDSLSSQISGDGFVVRLSADAAQVLYATYCGGSLEDRIIDMDLAPDGSISIVGETRSRDFPTTLNGLHPDFPVSDALPPAATFAAKISPDGSGLVYSTFLGASDFSSSLAAVAADDGSLLVAGSFPPDDFPFTEGALRLDSEGFLLRLDAAGERLVYAAGVGGFPPPSLDVDAEGNAYLTVRAKTASMPPTASAIKSCGSATDVPAGIVAKIDPSGSQVLYATYLSADLSMSPAHVAVGPAGSIFVAGSGFGRHIPATEPFPPHHRDEGVFLAQIDPGGRRRDLFASMIRSSASYRGGPVAPGEWVSVFSPPFGPEAPAVAQLDEAGRLPTELAGVRVLFDGVAAPITYAHRCQVNVIAPFGLGGASETDVVVEYQGERSNAVRLPVSEAAPALFSSNATGFGDAAALNDDSTVNTFENPAVKGSIVALFGTGAGLLDAPLEDGEIPRGSPPLIAGDTKVFVRDATRQWVEAEVVYAGAAPGLIAGLVQINFRIPADVRVFRDVFFPKPLDVRWVAQGRESPPLGVWVEP